ncbi:MAG: oligosaccharide repeat unit polymerase [Pseudomonas sp.]|nr:oligosaccharide repeat unit polymerase [Pseudomonas sp.]
MISLMAQLLIWMSLCVFLIGTLIIIVKDNYGFIGLGFCIYWILFFLFPATFHLKTGVYPFYSMSYEEAPQAYAALAVLIFSLFFFLGFFIKSSKKIKKYHSPNLSVKVRNIYIFLFFSLAIQFYLIASHGASLFLVSRSDFNLESFGSGVGGVALVGFIRSLSFATVLVVFFLLRRQTSTLVFALCATSSLVTFAVVNFPLALPRYIFFSYILSLIYILLANKTRNKFYVFSLFALGVTTVFPAFSNLTRHGGRFVFDEFTKYYSSSGDFDGFQSLINTLIYVTDNGLSYGYQALGVILVLIPRAFWPDKPLPTGSLVSEHLGYSFVNISAPIISEIYIDFGWIGLPILSFILGILLRTIDLHSIISKKSGDWVGIFVSAAIFSTIIIVMRGSLMAIISNVVLLVLLVWFTARISVRR